MRYVPVSCLREGMNVAKNLYDKNGQLLIKWGTVLKDVYIVRIKDLGYQGVYIDDDISKDLIIESAISDQLRIKAVQSIKDGFTQKSIYVKDGSTCFHMHNILDVVEEIVNEILTSNVSMINLIDLKSFDEYTYFHSVNVCILAIMVGLGLGYDRHRLTKLGLGAILHDIGKVFIDKEVLNKNGKLTDDEFTIMKNHPMLGYNYLKNIYNILPTVYRCVLDHHERYDGSGYPYQLIGDSISEFGRVVCICDVYDALVSNRPYRKAILPSEAIEYIMGNSGAIFDPSLVEIFIRKVAPYPVGTLVKLCNGYQAIVIDNYEECCLRPKIRVIYNESGEMMNEEWDLSRDQRFTNITIIETSKQ